MNLPQLLTVAFLSMALGLALCKLGESEKTDREILFIVLGQSILWALLIWGGFFSR